MQTFDTGRRQFLATMGLGAGAGIGLGLSPKLLAGGAGTAPTKLLLYVFLRGGMDGLSYIIPTGGPNQQHYAQDRDNTFIEPGNTISLADMAGGSDFGLNPLCTDLYSIRDNVAFIHACGHPLDALTRSHFDAQEEIELGTPGNQSSSGGGFLSRYLQATSHSPDAIFTSMAASSTPPVSLAGYADVAALDSPGGFNPNTGRYGDTHLLGLADLYGGSGSLDLAGQSAIEAVELISTFDLENYVPGGGIVYPDTSIGDELALIAQLWKLDIGISVATLDTGGWDTHNGQQPLNPNTGFGRNIRELSEALTAFYLDIANDAVKSTDDICVVVQSEFGRQVSENGNNGTDHGFATPMTVIGGRIAGGVYGTFPSIATVDREGDGVVPTTDFRQVHGTVMDVVLGSGAGVVNSVFPGFNYAPLAIV